LRRAAYIQSISQPFDRSPLVMENDKGLRVVVTNTSQIASEKNLHTETSPNDKSNNKTIM
jgi:hypothetical protein